MKLTDLLIAKTKLEWKKDGKEPTALLGCHMVYRRVDTLGRIVLVNKKRYTGRNTRATLAGFARRSVQKARFLCP